MIDGNRPNQLPCVHLGRSMRANSVLELKGQHLQTVPLLAFSAAQIVKAYAERAGLEPVQIAGYLLRGDVLTSAVDAGVSVLKMMEVSRHTSVDTLRIYA
jgi:site-specific recombinase XerD